MDDIQSLVNNLTNSDNKTACRSMQQLENISRGSSSVYPFFDEFADLLDNANSYIRTRGIILIAVNSRWDIDFKIDDIIEKYLSHIIDDKPITSRQCIKYLPVISEYKPELRQDIINALLHADPSVYNESMQPLVIKDIAKCLRQIRSL